MKKGIEEQDKKYIIILKNVETKLNMFSDHWHSEIVFPFWKENISSLPTEIKMATTVPVITSIKMGWRDLNTGHVNEEK